MLRLLPLIPWSFPRFACDGPTLFKVFPEWKITEEEKQAFLADRAGCIVGVDTARKHGFKLGDRIPIAGDIFPVDLTFTVRGFHDAVQDNENLQFHYEYLRESLPAAFRGDVGTFVVLARSAQVVGRVRWRSRCASAWILKTLGFSRAAVAIAPGGSRTRA